MKSMITLHGRKYYVREGHTDEQILKSFVEQINNDDQQIFTAGIKDGQLNVTRKIFLPGNVKQINITAEWG